MAYEYEIKRIIEILEEVGVDMPLRFSDEQWMRNQLESLLDSVDTDGFYRGQDSVHECHDDECYGC